MTHRTSFVSVGNLASSIVADLAMRELGTASDFDLVTAGGIHPSDEASIDELLEEIHGVDHDADIISLIDPAGRHRARVDFDDNELRAYRLDRLDSYAMAA